MDQNKLSANKNVLGKRFTDALSYAALVHGTQRRKGGDIPYVGHLLGVASILIDAGAAEDEVIAGLLHDAVEDQGGMPRAQDIAARFGKRVVNIVLACSDAAPKEGEKKAEPKQRKAEHREHLRTNADPSVLLVSAADKLHNLRSMWADYQCNPETFWSRFNASAEESLENYLELATIFATADNPRVLLMVEEMRELIAKLVPEQIQTLDLPTAQGRAALEGRCER